MLMKTSTQSLTEQLAGLLAERIRTRLLAPGARLASVRECARLQGVSPSTVVAAYDQLLAQGLVEARRNRGFFVRDRGGRGSELSNAAEPVVLTAGEVPLRRPPVNAAALIRGMFHSISDKPQPGMGVFPPDWLETTFMPAAVRKVTSTRSLQSFSLLKARSMSEPGRCRPSAREP